MHFLDDSLLPENQQKLLKNGFPPARQAGQRGFKLHG